MILNFYPPGISILDISRNNLIDFPIKIFLNVFIDLNTDFFREPRARDIRKLKRIVAIMSLVISHFDVVIYSVSMLNSVELVPFNCLLLRTLCLCARIITFKILDYFDHIAIDQNTNRNLSLQLVTVLNDSVSMASWAVCELQLVLFFSFKNKFFCLVLICRHELVDS
ncbi:hypothetical protein PHYBLDRAFT_73097 [Phycomyces blakesleeanus NRRL 1555(-)]|uniref:Uncharacterized protein n=1 Tax=Phycomyces blakesleeanus (strain ATCC 8743b / DSM 1359 / FGSC 10004 / NBRC 33097 / NRRL 1555) TaxID=763407 RepID=A0A162U1E2_PHYB8|nr:hypothetical protein PHYBLDRAFT_73097 [Phycomyces blakesleeanus NRRL 1555(-)]OAD72692.1 hypothetical protein PHYBLDRAFT_73097 [Phycomyces blakesleeanus NRRL 1555(-)]|eukprot:XP_018290732.1 hypothetical protein PHYBLDRAFT_73097 [Phycomyces blakesleeanus NRRL 1555(-)]